MTKRICLENITGQCRNPMKDSPVDNNQTFECQYCLREDGNDGHGDFLVAPEKALKVFEILKDKVKY
jgi:hypothetical protein